MRDAAWILEWGLLVWLLILAGVVALRVLSGSIHNVGLISHTNELGQRRIRPERLLLLASSLGYAVYYVTTALQTPLDMADPSLPEIPNEVVTAILGTNGAYLSLKLLQTSRRT